MLKIRHIKLVLLLFILIGGGFVSHLEGQKTLPDSIRYYTSKLNSVKKDVKLFPEESFRIYTNAHRYFSAIGDTTKQVMCLLNMSDIQRSRGKYSLAFDYLWEGLFLSKERGNKDQQAKVHRRLVTLYQAFNMKEAALEHMRMGLKVSKELFEADPADKIHLNASYMNLAVRERKSGNYHGAMGYLDSCIVPVNEAEKNGYSVSFVDAERGLILLRIGEKVLAHHHLHLARVESEKTGASYLGNIYIYLGELKMAVSDEDSAIYYFKKSLNHIDPRHLNNEPATEVLLRLSEIYRSRNRASLAYDFLYRAKQMSDSVIQVKNSTNSELFEIKNTYLESVKAKDVFIKEQREELKYTQGIQLRLQIILALTLLLGIVSYLVVRMRLKLNKTIDDKKKTELDSKLREEKNKAQIELKSKELTSYALQMIDKDTAIDELLKVLKEEAPQSHKSLNSKYKKGAQDLWDDFNRRFTEVNSAFYERIKAEHPELSVTELKHCALIKLNFSAKEMARILNIATHSVHISRSRIRKKIGLKREDSLSHYISEI